MALGSVSIIPYTRAEIMKMFKQQMAPYGKVVKTGAASFSYSEDGDLYFPDSTDYVVLTCYSCSQNVADFYQLPNGTKLVRGTSISTPGSRYYCTISFDADGHLSFRGFCSMYKSDRAYYTAEGYQYY